MGAEGARSANLHTTGPGRMPCSPVACHVPLSSTIRTALEDNSPWKCQTGPEYQLLFILHSSGRGGMSEGGVAVEGFGMMPIHKLLKSTLALVPHTTAPARLGPLGLSRKDWPRGGGLWSVQGTAAGRPPFL